MRKKISIIFQSGVLLRMSALLFMTYRPKAHLPVVVKTQSGVTYHSALVIFYPVFNVSLKTLVN